MLTRPGIQQLESVEEAQDLGPGAAVRGLAAGHATAECKVPAGLDVAHWFLPVGLPVVGGDWHDRAARPGAGPR